ncbi:GFA family protein [Pandoraea sputorum]|uniref:Aldehyde-activating protein n=1 Tax=Pandoraea sputorum TaxID=93222 RepID=A0A5E5AXD7_9BURK|nr:GFA family protein [Pandoraea sputorum]VVE78239.1 aldehyde-activating protein [Pandoraea sputorum]
MSLNVTCLCGNMSLSLQGSPAARANCHCSSCRDFYGTSVFSATAWASEAVTVGERAGCTFKHPEKQMTKTFCNVCGEVVFGTNRLGMRVVPNALTTRSTGGKIDATLAPTMHLFYRERVVDVVDDLPKYLDGWDGPTYVAA